jgi:hypothetical protein
MQILVEDPAVGAKSDDPIAQVAKAARAGAGGESERRGVGGDDLSAVLGIVAASSAVTVITTGTVGPVVAFRCFVVMLGGHVCRSRPLRMDGWIATAPFLLMFLPNNVHLVGRIKGENGQKRSEKPSHHFHSYKFLFGQ